MNILYAVNNSNHSLQYDYSFDPLRTWRESTTVVALLYKIQYRTGK